MGVYAAEEGCRHVLTRAVRDELRASWMLVYEGRCVVDEARDQNERALARLLLDFARSVS